jgi:short-subunit dehydrogenase
MNQINPPSVFITGASSGIGLDLAKLFALDGYRLFITAREGPRLDEAAVALRALGKAGVESIPDDLADAAAPARLAKALQDRGIVPDALVNNAGFGTCGAFVESDEMSQVQMLQVNVVALTHLTRLLLPAMVARGSGRILNVSSTASFQPGPYMAVYYASKAYVTSFSQALGYELRRSNITVTALCPGPTTTDFQRRAGVENSPLFEQNTMTAQEVARLGYLGMQRGRAIVVTGAKNRLMAVGSKFAPRTFATKVAGRLNEGRS